MIINFNISNFGAVKEFQSLTFEADRSDHLESTYVVHASGLRLLKIALIYGANASGKTTILNALEFLRTLVLEPLPKKTDTLEYQPFLFDADTPEENSNLSIEFLANDTRYFYEVTFTKNAIVKEILNYYQPKKANVFKRTTDLNNQFTEITFGNKIKIEKAEEKSLAANTLWNNTVFGGFLKTNVEVNELKEPVEWFKNFIHPLINGKTELESFITSKIEKGELSKELVINILKKADFHISDLIIKDNETALPDQLLDLIQSKLEGTGIPFTHGGDQGNLKSKRIEFVHTVNNVHYALPMEAESQGTRRYFGFAGLLGLLVQEPSVFSIDELESSLHPDLYVHFLLTFLLNTRRSQIIATTHNRELLDNRDLFRNDAIWFTDKNEHCATELFSLADFDSSVVRNSTNILNVYKSGKLRASPNLGDNFID